MPTDPIITLADYNDLCGENPLWDARAQCLYWTDMTGRRFYRYDWKARQSVVLKEALEICGAAFNAPGADPVSGSSTGWVIVNSGGICLWDGADSTRLIASEIEGRRCNMNDCIADPRGRLFAGSWYYDPTREDYPLGYLMRIDPDGAGTIVDDGIHLANGLGFSPDLSTLYFADSIARRIYAYDYEVATGSVRNRREFVRVPSDSGLPDGLTVDAEGYVWCAHWFGSCVVRYDPDGKIERTLATPAKQTSSIAFGGPDLTDLFITSAALSDSLPLAPPGYDPETGYIGGRLFHANVGIAGREEYRARIVPPHAQDLSSRTDAKP